MMTRHFGRYPLCALMLFASPALAQGADPARGEALYQNHCTGCHESLVHIRDQPQAHSLAELRRQVTRWATQVNKGWGPEEIEDVLDYLNVTYYGFTR